MLNQLYQRIALNGFPRKIGFVRYFEFSAFVLISLGISLLVMLIAWIIFAPSALLVQPQVSVNIERVAPQPIEDVSEQSAQYANGLDNLSTHSPLRMYAQKLDAIPEGPKISLILAGLGISQKLTEKVILDVPPTAALGFSPYGRNLESHIHNARDKNFELLLQVPMEPFNFPQNDPGPHTLMARASVEDNQAQLNWVLSRMSEYIGVMPHMGARFISHKDDLEPIMASIHDKGLGFIEPGISKRSVSAQIAEAMPSGTYLKVDVVLDQVVNRSVLEERLAQLEEIARVKGFAVGYVTVRPVTLDVIVDWTQLAQKRGFTLVPLSMAMQLEPNS